MDISKTDDLGQCGCINFAAQSLEYFFIVSFWQVLWDMLDVLDMECDNVAYSKGNQWAHTDYLSFIFCLYIGIILLLMCERKAWTKEEDQLLLRIMQEKDSTLPHRKMKWNEIADRISALTCKNARKGKQCRERWFNQLHPSISKEPLWTHDQEKILFKLQEEFGNHWAKISKHLPGRSDNNIKNYFYSCLRKALRKVNNFLIYSKRNARYKNLKAFQTSTLTKLLAVAENKTQNKIHIVKEEATNLAKQIKSMLVEIQVFQKLQPTDKDSQLLSQLVEKIQNFNRICKRKKMKKKETRKKQADKNCSYFNLKNSENESQEEIQEEGEDFQQEINEISDLESQPLKVQGEKNQPLQRSQPIHPHQETLSLKFPSSSSLDQNKKLRQPVIIPSCHYNRPPRQAPPKLSKNQNTKTSLEMFDSVAIENSTAQPSLKTFVPLIPIAHSGFYHGSAFMPTLYSPSQLVRTPQDAGLQSLSLGAIGSGMLCSSIKSIQSLKNAFHQENKINSKGNQEQKRNQ